MSDDNEKAGVLESIADNSFVTLTTGGALVGGLVFFSPSSNLQAEVLQHLQFDDAHKVVRTISQADYDRFRMHGWQRFAESAEGNFRLYDEGASAVPDRSNFWMVPNPRATPADLLDLYRNLMYPGVEELTPQQRGDVLTSTLESLECYNANYKPGVKRTPHAHLEGGIHVMSESSDIDAVGTTYAEKGWYVYWGEDNFRFAYNDGEGNIFAINELDTGRVLQLFPYKADIDYVKPEPEPVIVKVPQLVDENNLPKFLKTHDKTSIDDLANSADCNSCDDVVIAEYTICDKDTADIVDFVRFVHDPDTPYWITENMSARVEKGDGEEHTLYVMLSKPEACDLVQRVKEQGEFSLRFGAQISDRTDTIYKELMLRINDPEKQREIKAKQRADQEWIEQQALGPSRFYGGLEYFNGGGNGLTIKELNGFTGVVWVKPFEHGYLVLDGETALGGQADYLDEDLLRESIGARLQASADAAWRLSDDLYLSTGANANIHSKDNDVTRVTQWDLGPELGIAYDITGEGKWIVDYTGYWNIAGNNSTDFDEGSSPADKERKVSEQKVSLKHALTRQIVTEALARRRTVGTSFETTTYDLGLNARIDLNGNWGVQPEIGISIFDDNLQQDNTKYGRLTVFRRLGH